MKKSEVNFSAFRSRYNADQIGLLGSVGGSWQKAGDWRCSGCGGTERLIAWRGLTIVGTECMKCQDSPQLCLSLEITA